MKQVILAIILCFFSSISWATTVTFQDGVSSYTGEGDASIFSYSTNENNNSAPSIRALSDGAVFVVRFDVSSIPTSATVTAATVTIYQSEQNCSNVTIGVRKIQDPDASGSPNFNLTASGGDTFNTYADWLYKNHSTTTKWSTAGGSANFTDVNNNSNETTQASGSCPGFVSTTFSIPVMVQSWVTTPSSNAGMVFQLTATGKTLVASGTNGTVANRPSLSVTYTTGGAINHGYARFIK